MGRGRVVELRIQANDPCAFQIRASSTFHRRSFARHMPNASKRFQSCVTGRLTYNGSQKVLVVQIRRDIMPSHAEGIILTDERELLRRLPPKILLFWRLILGGMKCQFI